MKIKRPKVYFRDFALWPAEITLELVMPAMLVAEYGEEEARRLIEAEVRKLESEALEKSKELGVPFAGRRKVLNAHHTKRARSYEVFGSRNPRFKAAGDIGAALDKIDELRREERQYKEALGRWTAGDRRAIFPYGTWWMKVHHGARVHPPP